MIDLSSYAQTLEYKSVAVFGLGLSGLSCVRALINAKINVVAWDDNQDNCDKAQAYGAIIEDLTKSNLTAYDFLILAPGVPYTYEPHVVVLNAQKYNLEIIGDLELLYRSKPSFKTIGITGTNGKSTTTALMKHVLNECGIKADMGGNIGKAVMDLDVGKDIEVLVLEISSYQMDLCPSYRPDISILLNITPDHLDRHGSMEAYVEAKARIMEGEGTLLIGVDDDYTLKLFNHAFCEGKRKIIPISVQDKAIEGFYVEKNILKKNAQGQDIEIGSLDNLETLRGLHNQQNATFVYVAAKELGLQDKDILQTFKTYPGLPHRQYLVTKIKNVSYINDSKATNAEAAAKALSSYDNIFWIIGGRPKKGGLQGLEIFKNKIIKSYVIGEATDDFSAWLTKNNFDFESCGTLDKAVIVASKQAQDYEGEAVVLLSPACASWDQFLSFEKRGDAFEAQVLNIVG